VKLSELCYEVGYSFYKGINGGYYTFILTDNKLYMIDTWHCTEKEMLEIEDASKVRDKVKQHIITFDKNGVIIYIEETFKKYLKYFSKTKSCYEDKTQIELDTVIC
jgi:iron only hydrogenase large subunit-like protein